MNNGVKVAIAILLFAIAGILLLQINVDPDKTIEQPMLYLYPVVPAVIGVLLLFSGLFFRLDDNFDRVIIKKATPKNFFIGLAIVCTCIVVLYLFHNVFNAAPRILIIAALLGVPVGVIIMGNVYSEACEKCESSLSSKSEIRKEISFQELLPSDPNAKEYDILTFSHCSRCSNFVKIKYGKTVHLIEGSQATNIYMTLIDEG